MIKNFIYLIKETFREWSEDKATRLAAALAYYTGFSLAPLMVVIIAIAGLFGGEQAVHGYVIGQIENLLGPEGGEFVASMIQNASNISTGVIATALLFTIGKFALGLYLGKSDVGSTFGAAGSLALLLIWVYYSSQILFFGAEFTQVYANKFGSRVVPVGYAIKLSEKDRRQQSIPHEDVFAKQSTRSE